MTNKEIIASKEREIQRLIDNYGDSICPSWVGEEIGQLLYEIKYLKDINNDS